MADNKNKNGGRPKAKPKRRKTIYDHVKDALEVASTVNSAIDLAVTVYNKIPDEFKDFIMNCVTLSQFSPLTVALAHVEFKKPLNRSVIKKMMSSEPGRLLFIELLQNYISYLEHRNTKFDPNVHLFIASQLLRLKVEMKKWP